MSSLTFNKKVISVIVASGIAVIAGFICYQLKFYFMPGTAGDFSWALVMAKDLLSGKDPYNFTPSPLIIPYPLPIIFFGIPFLGLSNQFAAAAFFGISSGILAFGMLSSNQPWRLLSFLSLPYVYALIFVQWSPLIMMTWFFPILAPTLALIKPQTALPIVANKITRKGIILGGGILLLSLLIYPTWPLRWYTMTRDFDFIIPLVILPIGPLLLLAAIFWKRPEARLLLAYTLMPIRGAYDLLALWLIPQSWQQIAFLTAVPWIAALIWPNVTFAMIKSPFVVPILLFPALLTLFWESVSKDHLFHFAIFGKPPSK